MSYASVMVHLDRSEHAMHRLKLAAQYAQAHRATLIGVYASFAPSPSWFYMMEGAARYLEEDRARRDSVRDLVHARFRNAMEDVPVQAEWRAVEGDPVALVLREAREADLLVVGQRNPDDADGFIAAEFVETLLLESGRPVLVVPYAGSFTAPPPAGSRGMERWPRIGARIARRHANAGRHERTRAADHERAAQTLGRGDDRRTGRKGVECARRSCHGGRNRLPRFRYGRWRLAALARRRPQCRSDRDGRLRSQPAARACAGRGDPHPAQDDDRAGADVSLSRAVQRRSP